MQAPSAPAVTTAPAPAVTTAPATPPLPGWVRAELRASHMGEMVAVRLYDGVLAATRDPALARLARAHREIERAHLAAFEAVMAPADTSRLMPLWRALGWLMGWLPALIGPAAVHAVVAGVESWVTTHYAGQIERIARWRPDEPLLALLRACAADEASHAGEAAARPHDRAGGILARLFVLAAPLGVALARRI